MFVLFKLLMQKNLLYTYIIFWSRTQHGFLKSKITKIAYCIETVKGIQQQCGIVMNFFFPIGLKDEEKAEKIFKDGITDSRMAELQRIIEDLRQR